MIKRGFFLASAATILQVTAFAQVPLDTAYFTQLVNKKFNYFLAKDTASLNTIIHPNCTYIHSSGLIDTRASLYKSLFKTGNPYVGFEVGNTVVSTINKLTVIVGFTVQVAYANEASNSKLLVTEVYTKQKKRWLLVRRHANKLAK